MAERVAARQRAGRELHWWCPQLPPSPRQAIDEVLQEIAPWPVDRVAVAGQDNSALKIESVGPATAAAALPADGAAAYDMACTACHGTGIAGAPKSGDKGAWGPRIAQGKETLYKHALEGYTGKTGMMPAKGGQTAWPDDLVKQAVDHMVEMSR